MEENKISLETEEAKDSGIKLENWKEFEDFYEAHNLQLYGINFPKELAEKLYYKLKHEIFDSTRFFEVLDNQEEEKFILSAKIPIKKNTEVFLVDHCWTFKIRQFNEYCEKNPNIIDRVYKMLKYGNIRQDIPGLTSNLLTPDEENKNIQDNLSEEEKLQNLKLEEIFLNLDDKELNDKQVLEYNLDNKTEALSLENNKIESFDTILEFLTSTGKNIKALWIEGNPFEESVDNYEFILCDMFPQLELINRKFSKNASQWSLNFIISREKLEKIKNKNLSKFNNLYGNVTSLDLSQRDFLKITNLSIFEEIGKNVEILDTSNNNFNFSLEDKEIIAKFLQFLKYFPKLNKILTDEILPFEDEHEHNLHSNESYHTSLINFIRTEKNYEIISNLCPSLKFINEYSFEKLSSQELDFLRYHKENWVRNHMWKFIQTYRLMTSEKYDEDATWYINDEIGNAINHSDAGNVALFPFIFSPSNKFKDDMITYSILWPIKEIKKDQEILRDFLANISETEQRSARLTCWFNTPEEYFLNKFKNKILKYSEVSDKFESVKKEFEEKSENLKNNKLISKDKYFIENFVDKKIKIKVFSDLPYVKENVTLEFFEITDIINEADILWLNMDYFKLAESLGEHLKPIIFKNQFPYENIITMKSHLTDLVQNNIGLNSYFSLSYNMTTELAEIIGNFLYNKENNFDNSWILKPINMARSMDMIVTNNIKEIIRSVETGPKICQKYLERPLLINKKKFDLRFIILLKKLVQLELYFYSKMFWVRSANKDFTMDSSTFTDYEVHFTVMNYNTFGMQTIYDKDFMEYLNKNNIEWDPIYKKIKTAMKDMFLMTGKDCPQMSDEYSRAIYGLDVMIDENLEPKVLEINYSPDCTRACKFIPEFYNDIFSTLFLENPSGVELL